MNAALRRGVVSGIFAGGFVLLGVTTATSASADTGDPGLALAGSTSGTDGVGSGNQTDLDLDAPLRAVGNQVTVLGDDNENQSTTAGAPAAPAPSTATTSDTSDTSGEDGVLSGNQTTVSACAPVTVDGNQVTVVGDGNDGTAGGSGDACESVTVGEADETSGDDDGVASGNQTSVEVCVPVTVSGNQVTGVGDDNEASSEEAGATCGAGERTADETSGDDGLLSGNQTALDVCVPVTATGNQLTAIGDDNESSSSGDGSSCGDTAEEGTTGDTSGEDGLGSGNQTALDPNVPVDVIGNQVTVIGDGNSNGSTSSGGDGDGSGAGTGGTSGEDGTGSGNQTVVDLLVPVDAVGNQVTVIGDDNSNESTSSGESGDGSGAGTGDTSGEDGTGSGNQTVLDPTVPVDVEGNQVTVIGDGNTNGSTEEDPGEDPGDDPGDGDGDGDGDGPGEGPGGQDGGDDSPGDIDVLPGQARAGALVAAPRAPSEVQAGLHVTAPTTTSPSSPVLPLLMLLLGVLCVALAGRRLPVGRT